MPFWWVSEPYINLRLEDEPLGYQPARGLRVAFHLSYRQRGVVTEDPAIFGVGTNWSCSFRTYLVNLTGRKPGWMRLHRWGAGWIDYFIGATQYRDGSILSQNGDSYQIEYPDGAVDVFGNAFANSTGFSFYFLTSHIDRAGNTTTFAYSTIPGVVQLLSVIDSDGKTTQLFYENTTFTNLITKVVDPFSRTNLLQYDDAGYLTNIVDVAQLATSFIYDTGARRGWITSMTTPYGTTSFRYGGVDADSTSFYSGGNQVNRFVEITLPTGGKHLYL